MTKSVKMTWAEKLSIVGHLVRDAYRCMTKVVAAFTIASDPVDGGTWGRHGGAVNSQTQHVCARFRRRDCEKLTIYWRIGLLVISFPETKAPVCLPLFFGFGLGTH